MNSDEIKDDNSEIFQKAFITRFCAIFIPVLFFIFLGYFWFISDRNARYKETLKSTELSDVRVGKTLISESLQDVNRSLIFLANSFSYHDSIESFSALSNIEKEWVSFINVEGDLYTSVSFVNLSGKELISVSNNSEKCSVSIASEYDFSKDSFFSETVNLNPYEIAVSECLFEGSGGSSVSEDNSFLKFGIVCENAEKEKNGVILLTYDCNRMFIDFINNINNNANYVLVADQKCRFLKKKSPDERNKGLFASEEFNLASSYPQVWQSLITSVEGQFSTDMGLWTFDTVYPLMEGHYTSLMKGGSFKAFRNTLYRKQYFWKIISFVPSQEYELTLDDFCEKHVLFVVCLFVLIGLWGSLVLAYSHANVRNISFYLHLRVAELHEANRIIKLNETLHTTTLKSIGDAVISTNAQGQIVLMNTIAQHLTGWNEQDAYGKELKDVFCIKSEITGELVESPVEKVLKCGRIVELANHTVLTSKDGLDIPIADSAAPIRNDEGQVVGVVLVFRDQTSERAILRKLETSEANYRSLFENMPDGFGMFKIKHDEHGEIENYDIIQVNEALSKMLDIDKEDVKGRKIFDVIPDMGEEWKTVFNTVAKSKASVGYEGYSRVFDAYLYVIAFCPRDGYLAVIANDISERKDMESKLRYSQKFLRTIIDTLPSRIFWKNKDLEFMGCNIAFAHDAGLDDPEDLIGKTDYEMSWAATDATQYIKDDKEIMESKKPRLNFEESQVYPDGTQLCLRTSKLPLMDEEGNCIGVDHSCQIIKHERS